MRSKKALIIAVVIAAAILTGWFAFKWFASSNMASRKLIKELQALVETGSDGLYSLEIGSVKVLPEELKVLVYDVKFIPDESRYATMKNAGNAAPDLFTLSADKITINNITPADFIVNKSILLQSVELHEAMIQVTHDAAIAKKLKDSTQENDAPEFNPEQLYERLRKDVRKISVDTLILSSLDLRYINLKPDQKKSRDTTFLRELDLFAENLLMDESTVSDSTRFLFTKKLLVRSRAFETPVKDDFYKLKFDTLTMVIAGGITNTRINGFALEPQYSEVEYSKRVETQLERFGVSIPSIRMIDFKYSDFLQNGIVVADSLQMNRAEINVYKDRTKMFDGKTRLGKYPHQLLQQSGLPVNVNVCTFENTSIAYRERSDKTEQVGEVRFENISASIRPVRSIPDSLQEPVYVDADALFMGITPLKAKFVLYPASKDGDFRAEGDFGKMQLNIINKATVHLGEVEIEEGQVEELSFKINGNDFYSTTDLHFKYSGLKASMLKQEDGDEYRKKGLMSLIANTFVIKSDNHKREQHVVVRYKRDTNKSMFNLIWKGVFSGMKELAGAGKLGKDKDRVEIIRKN